MRVSNFRQFLALGLHSAAIIAFQISLMQLVSNVQWHHFAYMVISVAMLGFGAAGTALAIGREKLLIAANWLIPLLMILSGALMAVVFPITNTELLQFDVFALFTGGWGFTTLVINYLIFFLPLFFGALAIGIIFLIHSNNIGSYYFANLTGSGLGGVLALFFMSWALPLQVSALVGTFSVLSGVMLSDSKTLKQNMLAALLSLMVIGWVAANPGVLRPSSYKDIALARQIPGTELRIQKPSIYGFVEVLYAPKQRFAPALSLTYQGEAPGGYIIFVNGNYYSHVLNQYPQDIAHILDYTTMKLPFVLGNPQRVLCVNAGSGIGVSHALHHGAAHVDAIIENRKIVSLLKNELSEASGGVLLHPKVEVHPLQTRNFLARTDSNYYDLVILPLLSEFGGGAGLHSLREDYDLTIEAFVQMIRTLRPQGMVSVSTWVDHPPRYSLKLLATLVQAAKKSGFEHPAKHIVALRSWGTITFLLQKTPFADYQLEKLRKFSQELQFDPFLMPELLPFERDAFNALSDATLFQKADSILNSSATAISGYDFNIAPATDNQPFFSNFVNLGKIPRLLHQFDLGKLPFLELGFFLLLATLAKSIILAVLLIIIPLFVLKKSQANKRRTLLYFSALGLGYMFVEIILIQKFVLYLGQPMYAVVAVVGTMMLSSGFGSLFSQKLLPNWETMGKVGVFILGLLIIKLLILTPLLQHTLAANFATKVVLSLIAIGLPAFVMGMMFPLGIRYLHKHHPAQIPWAWGINACMSVVSTSAATLVSVEAGFQTVILIAILIYLVAAVAFYNPFSKKVQPFNAN